MKATFTKKIAVLCLSAVMALGVGVGVSSMRTVEAATIRKAYDFTTVNSSYVVNTKITVTDDANAQGVVFPKTYKIGEVTTTIDSVTYPSGIVEKVDDKINLDELGKYSIAYKGVSGTPAVTTIYYENFIVNNEFLDSLGGATGSKYSEVNPDIPGIKVSIKDGTSAKFNSVISLDDKASDGFVELIKFKHNSSYTMIRRLKITVTDALNPSNYFAVNWDTINNGVGGYFNVNTSTIPAYGLLASGDRPYVNGSTIAHLVYIDGVRYLNKNKNGTMGLGIADYIIKFNPETNQVVFVNPNDSTAKKHLIADLDCVEAYPANTKVFGGFTSNEVYISISGENFEVPTIEPVVLKLGNVSGSELESLYDLNTVYDKSAPTITIDCVETVSGAVYAKLGSDFTIPQATAIDANKASEVTYRVYKNYTAASKAYVSFDSATRSFKLAENVVYTIEFTSTDAYGNKAVKTLKVIPKKESALTGGDIIIDDNIRFAANKFSFVNGNVCVAPIFNTFESLNKDSARELNLTITKDNAVVFAKEYTAKDFVDGVPTLDYQVVSAGNYVVTYKLNDNINSAEYSYTVTATSQNVVNFVGKPLLQRNYIALMSYPKPDFTAYTFADKLTSATTQVFVSYDDGAWEAISGESFVVKNASTIKFKYVAGNNEIVTENANIIDVRNADAIANNSEIVYKGSNANLDLTKYFTGDFVIESVAPANEMRFVANIDRKVTNTCKISYINPLTFNDGNIISIALKTLNDYSDYTSLSFVFTDAYDPTNVLRVTYEVINNETNIIVNDLAPYLITTSIYEQSYNVKYNISNKRVTTSNVNFDYDWQPTNNLFYFDVELGGITGSYAGVIINTISNQKFTTSTKTDNTQPLLNYTSSAGTYPIDSDITIYKPNCLDILTPFILNKNTVKVKVTLSKKPVTSVDGVLLDGTQDPNRDYVVKLAEFATYKVDYYIYDTAGNEYAKTYRFTGADTNKPVITLGYNFTEDTIHNVTLGKPFTISYDVTDDYTVPEKLVIAVKIISDADLRVVYTANPQETITQDSDLLNLITDTCTITRKGMYTVYIYATDEAFNTSYAKYKLNVQ